MNYTPDCADCPTPAECKAANDCAVMRQIRHPQRSTGDKVVEGTPRTDALRKLMGEIWEPDNAAVDHMLEKYAELERELDDAYKVVDANWVTHQRVIAAEAKALPSATPATDKQVEHPDRLSLRDLTARAKDWDISEGRLHALVERGKWERTPLSLDDLVQFAIEPRFDQSATGTLMTLSRQGVLKLKEWIALLNRDGWSKPDKQWLVDFWLEHHDEDGVVIAKGHPRYFAARVSE